MRVVVAGTPDVAVPSLEAIESSSHRIAGVLTRPDARAGRGRHTSRSAVARWADERGLPVLQPPRLSAPGVLDELRALGPDCCPVIAYGALIPKAALDVAPHGWVNLHFSLLPAWRGAAPVQRAVMAGDDVTGATTFRLEEGLDTGPVLGVVTEAIRPGDTAGDLLGRLAVSGAGLLVATLDGLEAGRLVAVPQPAEAVSVAPKVGVAEAEVEWELPALAVDRRIRGCTPDPGAWTTWRGSRLGLGPLRRDAAEALDRPDRPLSEEPGQPGQPEQPGERAAPGALRVTRSAVLVATGSGEVALGTVRPAGRRPMPALDWARGARPEPGERFTRAEAAGALL